MIQLQEILAQNHAKGCKIKMKLYIFKIIISMILLSHFITFNSNNSYSFSFTQDYFNDPVLLEIINADNLIGRQIVELSAKEIENESKREIVFLTYLIDPPNSEHFLTPNKDSLLRGEILLSSLKKRGISETVLNGRHLFAGISTLSNLNRKEELKHKIYCGIKKCLHKDYFSLIDYSITKDINYKLLVNLRANKRINFRSLNEVKVLIFLVVDEIKSKYPSELSHRNVAYNHIPIEGFESDEFDGTGNSLKKIIHKEIILEGDELCLISKEFKVDMTLQANWSIVIIIENNKNRFVLFNKKIKLKP